MVGVVVRAVCVVRCAEVDLAFTFAVAATELAVREGETDEDVAPLPDEREHVAVPAVVLEADDALLLLLLLVVLFTTLLVPVL